MSARRKSLLTFLVVPLVLLLSLVAVGVANASRSTGTSHRGLATPTITISSFAYSGPGTVKAGTQIKIINKDAVAHTVTSDKRGRFNVTIPAHSTRFLKAPIQKSTYLFHCTIHASMHGVMHVN